MRYTGAITFIYYTDFAYGNSFVKNILGLKEVMDQGFAKVFQVNEKSFLGIVEKTKARVKGDTLFSLNTNNLLNEYSRIQQEEVFFLSEIKSFPQIPLKSFFFDDKEGHHFEIQEFQNEKDKNIF